MSAPACPSPLTLHDPNVPRSFHIDADGTLRRDLCIADLRQVIDSAEGKLWVDVDVGNRHHIAILEKLWGFHPLSMEDLLNPNSRVKVEEYPGYLFTIIRGVRFHQETDDPYDLETFNLNFFLGPHYVVTAHSGQTNATHVVAERVERNPDLLARGVDRLMHAVMDVAVDAYFPLLDQIDEFIDGLEERVFDQFDQVVLRDIFAVKRLVLSLRRHLAPQREVFNVLTNRPNTLLAPEAQVYFRDIHDHVLRITESLENYRDLLGSTLDSYLTQVSNRLGSVTKGLSVVATMSIPFVVVSGMWGMNFERIPLSHQPHAFWWMLALQLAAGFLLYLVLRWRKLI